MGSGFCQPSSFFYRRCLAAVSTSLLSVRGLSVGSASFNHVDHQRSDLYFRRQPARRDFRVAVSYVQYLLQLIFCLRAVPFCVAGFVVWLATACYAVAFLPVDRSYGAARLPHKFSQSVSFSSEVKHTSVLY